MGDLKLPDVEEGLSDPVGDRSGVHAFGGFNLRAARASGMILMAGLLSIPGSDQEEKTDSF